MCKSSKVWKHHSITCKGTMNSFFVKISLSVPPLSVFFFPFSHLQLRCNTLGDVVMQHRQVSMESNQSIQRTDGTHRHRWPHAAFFRKWLSLREAETLLSDHVYKAVLWCIVLVMRMMLGNGRAAHYIELYYNISQSWRALVMRYLVPSNILHEASWNSACQKRHGWLAVGFLALTGIKVHHQEAEA